MTDSDEVFLWLRLRLGGFGGDGYQILAAVKAALGLRGGS